MAGGIYESGSADRARWPSVDRRPVAPRPSPARSPHLPGVKIVARYILKEHAGPLMFALSALTSLLLLNFVAKKFGDLVGKEIGRAHV